MVLESVSRWLFFKGSGARTLMKVEMPEED